jgi:hypothetical protein
MSANESDPSKPEQAPLHSSAVGPHDVNKPQRPQPAKVRGLPKWLLQLLTLLVVPLGIAMVNSGVANYAGRQKSIELAISLLREPLQEGETKGEVLPLRDWAVNVVNKLSEVPFSDAAASLLRTGQRTLPRAETLYPPVDGYCEVTPKIAEVGSRVTFTAGGLGGANQYVYTWLGDDGVVSQHRTVTVVYHTPGPKSATVRITSNGQNVYRTATVQIRAVGEKIEPDKADVMEEH